LLGYIKACRPELKPKEYEIYKGVYCSLCRNLGRRYSPFAQLLLSYDFSFLALLRLATVPEEPDFVPKRCPYNPLHKCPGCGKNANIDFCADAVIIISYYKLLDNIQDSGFFKKILYFLCYPPLAWMHRKAARAAPRLEEIVWSSIQRQNQIESRSAVSLDEAADPSAEMIAGIFSLGECDEAQKARKRRLGYLLGRWVYLMDALDDWEDDLKDGVFNPLKEKVAQSGPEALSAYAGQTITLTAGAACEALAQLRVARFQGILENILYDGLTDSLQTVLGPAKEGGAGVEKSI